MTKKVSAGWVIDSNIQEHTVCSIASRDLKDNWKPEEVALRTVSYNTFTYTLLTAGLQLTTSATYDNARHTYLTHNLRNIQLYNGEIDYVSLSLDALIRNIPRETH